MDKVWVTELKELLSLNVNGKIVEALKEIQEELKSNDVSMSFEPIYSQGIVWDIRIDNKRVFISEKEIGRIDKPIFNEVDENYNPIGLEYENIAKEKLERIILEKLNQIKDL